MGTKIADARFNPRTPQQVFDDIKSFNQNIKLPFEKDMKTDNEFKPTNLQKLGKEAKELKYKPGKEAKELKYKPGFDHGLQED